MTPACPPWTHSISSCTLPRHRQDDCNPRVTVSRPQTVPQLCSDITISWLMTQYWTPDMEIAWNVCLLPGLTKYKRTFWKRKTKSTLCQSEIKKKVAALLGRVWLQRSLNLACLLPRACKCAWVLNKGRGKGDSAF